MTLPDPAGSRAVLIGVSQYDTLSSLPAVKNNLDGLAEVFTDKKLWGLPKKCCRRVHNPQTPGQLLGPVEEAAEQATDTLLVYYGGHGCGYEENSGLHLTLAGSNERSRYTAVSYDYLRDVLLKTRARRRIVILDCCFSGRAVGLMGLGEGALADQLVVEGAYVLASAPSNEAALAPPGETYTAFTAELLRILHNGVPDGPPVLDLNTVFVHLRANLRAQGRPEPQKREHNTAGALALARNRAWRRLAANGAAKGPSHSDISAISAVKREQGGVLRLEATHEELGEIQRKVDDSTAIEPVRLRMADHRSCLTAAAFNTKGTLLATSSSDHTIAIWNTRTKDQIAKLVGHMGCIGSLAFSPNGSILLSASRDGTTRIWRIADWTERQTLETNSDRVNSVAFSPDGAHVAAALDNRRTLVWSTQNWNLVATLEGHHSAVNSCAWSTKHAMLATASRDAVIRIWDANEWKEVRRLQGHNGSVSALAFSPEGSYLASGGRDKTIRLWTPSTGKLLRALSRHDEWITSLTFASGGSRLISVGTSGSAQIWDTEKWSSASYPLGRRGSVATLAVGVDSQVAFVGRDGPEIIDSWAPAIM